MKATNQPAGLHARWQLLLPVAMLLVLPVAAGADLVTSPPMSLSSESASAHSFRHAHAMANVPAAKPNKSAAPVRFQRVPPVDQAAPTRAGRLERLPPVIPTEVAAPVKNVQANSSSRQTAAAQPTTPASAAALVHQKPNQIPLPPSAMFQPTPVHQGQIGGPRYEAVVQQREHSVPAEPVDVLETLPRVSAIAENQMVQRHVQAGFALAHRGAYYSAKREFEQSLRLIAESLDAQQINGQHGTQLTAAFDALAEADEFFVDDPRTGGRADLRNVAVTHRTPLMRAGKLAGLNQVEAMQAYYAYAQEQFQAALGSQPIAAEALYGLGRTYSALATTEGTIGRLHGPKSLLMHQVATQIDPNHSLAANELGVLLARFGQLAQAKQALLHTPAENRLAETWHNLAVIHERLGEQQLAEQARREYASAIEKEKANERLAKVQEGGVEWYDVSAAETKARQEAPAEKTTPRTAARPAPTPRWPWSTPR